MNNKPECNHGQTEAHSFLAQVRIGDGIHYTTETMWCPGPQNGQNNAHGNES